MLSQFKYHFILRKVYMPRSISLQQLSESIHEGFGVGKLTPNSIYIIQIVNVYERDLVDLAVGFRRDEDAMKIAREVNSFEQKNNYRAKIQLASGFKIFMDQLKYEAESNLEHEKFIDIQEQNLERVQSKDNKEIILLQEVILQEPELQRERSRDKPHKKKDVRERFKDSIKSQQGQIIQLIQSDRFKIVMMLIPEQTTKNIIITSIQKKIKDIKQISLGNFIKRQVPLFQLTLNKEEDFELLIKQPLKIEYYNVLPLPFTENLAQQLLSRQLIYTCIQNSSTKSLASLLRELKSKKNQIINIIARPLGEIYNYSLVKTVNMASLDCGGSTNKEYVVTFFNKIDDLQGYMPDGWRIRKNLELDLFAQKLSVKWDWYRLMQTLSH